MSELQDEFQAASEAVRALPEKPDNETLLELYALYKQGSEGDVSGERPGLFDFVGGAKYDAWEKLSGMPRETAQQAYIDLVRNLGAEWDA